MSTQPLANELIEHYLDGVADVAELELLQRQLAEDPTAADAFADIARFEMLLQVHLTGASKETSLFPLPLEEERGAVTSGEDLEFGIQSSETARHSPKIVNQQSVPPLIHYPLSSFINSPVFPYVFSAFVMCVGALGAWCYQVDIPSPIARANRHAAATYALSKTESAAESIGRITGMVDCRWEKGSGFRGQGVAFGKSKIPNPQSLVSLGDRFVLASGLLEITYDTGAKVILQGPVTYQVDSAVGGFLSLGKLTAKLEKKGEGEKGKAKKPITRKPPFPRSPLSIIHCSLLRHPRPR